MSSTIASYVYSSSYSTFSLAKTGGFHAAGQIFTGNGQVLNSAGFYLKYGTTSSGNMVARVYAISGSTPNAVPTGSPLATSDPINSSTLTSSMAQYIFYFPTPLTTVNGTKYALVLDVSGTNASGSGIQISQNASAGLSGSNRVAYDDLVTGGWTSNSGATIVFGAYNNEGERHLIKTGDWSDPSVWSLAYGSAGGAGVPTASSFVYIDKNYTVTLSADSVASSIDHTNGTLLTAGHKLSVGGISSQGTNVRTLDISGSKIEVNTALNSVGDLFGLEGSNLTFNSDGSLITLSYHQPFMVDNSFWASGQTFNDVIINLGSSASDSVTLNIHGSPAFRSLIIQSKNSAAHTVNFDEFATLTTDKFVGIGSSSSNRLKITCTSTSNSLFVLDTSYGQYLNMDNIGRGGIETAYIGSNSITNGTWTTEDPPKISTLVDPLTTAPSSNTNWTVTGTVTQVTSGHDGGGYQFSDGSSITSTNTYDLIDNDFIFELRGGTGNLRLEFLRLASQGYIGDNYLDLYALDASGMEIDKQWGSGDEQGWLPSDVSYLGFAKIRINSNGTISAYYSTDGGSWTAFPDTSVAQYSSTEVALMRSARLAPYTYNGNSTIGSINPDLNQSPTVSLTTPTDSATVSSTTPTFTFVGTDPEGNTVTYEIQIDTVNTFDSQGA